MMSRSYLPSYRNSWALVIGINAYQHVAPLSYACNDADAVAGSLINDLSFPENQLALLKDGVATKEAILHTYLRFSESTGPDDRVLIFFAGHGTTFEGSRGQVGYLVPVDGDRDNKSTLIRWDDLTRNAELIPAKHILFIMDSCYSGLAIQRAILPGTERFLSDMLQRFSRQVITAGKADETVADGGGPQGNNSIFTGYLLEGLKGAAVDANRVLTANGLMAYVYQAVGQDNRSRQTPHYGHLEGDGDFVLRTPNSEHLAETFQSDYLVQTVIEVPESLPALGTPVAVPTFAQRNGYADPTNPNFGRNEWSNRLGEYRLTKDATRETSKAYSWLALVVEPMANYPISIDIGAEFETLSKQKAQSDNPYERFTIPREGITTLKSVVLFDRLGREPRPWSRYSRVEDSGNIEYSDCSYVFYALDLARCFRYVQVIGSIWQFIFFAKNVLSRAGYLSGVRLLVNLVGTRETTLADFAEGQGAGRQRWRRPFDPFTDDVSSTWKCYDANIQLEYQFVLQSMDQGESFNLIKDAANKLGLAYNHRSSPRCFNYNTEVFPWQQYLDGRW
jgi:hypothetical protein